MTPFQTCNLAAAHPRLDREDQDSLHGRVASGVVVIARLPFRESGLQEVGFFRAAESAIAGIIGLWLTNPLDRVFSQVVPPVLDGRFDDAAEEPELLLHRAGFNHIQAVVAPVRELAPMKFSERHVAHRVTANPPLQSARIRLTSLKGGADVGDVAATGIRQRERAGVLRVGLKLPADLAFMVPKPDLGLAPGVEGLCVIVTFAVVGVLDPDLDLVDGPAVRSFALDDGSHGTLPYTGEYRREGILDNTKRKKPFTSRSCKRPA